jgi:hypothetical protein
MRAPELGPAGHGGHTPASPGPPGARERNAEPNGRVSDVAGTRPAHIRAGEAGVTRRGHRESEERRGVGRPAGPTRDSEDQMRN